MRCHKVREWLLTDYRDGELDDSRKAALEGHLKECEECRLFEKETAGLVPLPFTSGPGELKPGPEVWERIREKISGESWRDRLAGSFSGMFRPVPLFRVAFALSLVLVVAVMMRFPSQAQFDPSVSEYLTEQMDLMSALGSGDPDLLNGDSPDFTLDFTSLA
ncbi:MAG TPA: anti-sigma factor [Candidatus Omnitrophota bacterium]|nr:anti-sigma factor [Candidatus Omnitrophota bacterium]